VTGDKETEAENKTASTCFGLPCGSIPRLPLAGLAGVPNWPMRRGQAEPNLLKIQQLYSPQHSNSRSAFSGHDPLAPVKKLLHNHVSAQGHILSRAF
jgi:hypothetical protein